MFKAVETVTKLETESDNVQMMLVKVLAIEPDINLIDIDQQEFELNFAVKGDKLVINMWYMVLLDMKNEIIWAKECQDQPQKEVLSQFINVIDKHPEIFVPK
ncbi:hypothetical protein SS50377_24304 [Spironucleus salmonicida]|uniref:Uncharacterized protein n=1 Tax=Spironucleus salmonicida TaxID=348837 RepID=V6LJS3_9EUKA|nr:hypothetical protein SS50377_24304 [Spironucleus salmonicida]|eukprot:EST44845.1 Hypothetical protein SS50377_15291 [Spironucleus salmonicida]